MSSKKRRTTILSLVLSTAAWGSLPQQLAQAQTVNGAFHGTVIDSTGAVVPGATVEVTNLATGLTRNASANQAGFYTITRSEEHTSELQSRQYLVCRLLLEKK